MTTMRKLGTRLLAMMLSFAFLIGVANDAKAQNDYVDFDVFYNELSPYGNWYQDPSYGYVWQPSNAGPNFQPYYTNGYWVMTEYGNTWVSNYNWGWAPFHYGRWQMSGMGWVWIPGTQWAPAWVDWRHGNGYYGWAPMGPGLQINVGRWNTPADWFVFVAQGSIYNRGFNNYYRQNNYMNIYNNTIVINNYYNDRSNRPVYNFGPRRDDIRRYTNRNVPVYNVTNAQTRGAVSGPRGNNISIYRPEVRQTNRNAAPRNVRTMDATTSRSASSNQTRSNNANNSSTINRSSTTTNNRATPANTNRNNRTAPANNYQNTPSRSVQSTPSTPSRSIQSTPSTPSRSVQSAPSTPSRSVQSTPSTPSRSVQSAPSTPSRSVQSTPSTPSRSVQSAPSTPSRSVQSAPSSSSRSVQSAPSSSNQRSGSSSGRDVNAGPRR